MPLQFVSRRDAVVVYRVGPVAGADRPRRQLLGSFSRHDFQFHPAEHVTMTEAEREEVEGRRLYLQLRDGIRQKLAAHELEDTVSDVLAYFASVTDEAEREILRHEMTEAARRLRQAVRAA